MRILIALPLVCLSLPSWAGMTVDLQPSQASPQLLGTPVTWSAQVTGASPGTLWYRFRARPHDSDFSVIRDFGPINSLDWTAADREGNYAIEVIVRNTETGETASAISRFEMAPLATDAAVVTTLNHPLVFLYSTPPCAESGRMRVEFTDAEGTATLTPWKNCTPDFTMNFYLAGIRPNAEYSARHIHDTGTTIERSEPLAFMSGDVPPVFGVYEVTVAPDSKAYGVLLQSSLTQMTSATDLAGNLLWFYVGDISSLTRPVGDGTFFGVRQAAGEEASRQVLRQFDVAGYTLKETNAARVSEQLLAMGLRPVTAFHHEARQLPDGKILVLASAEQFFTDVQGDGEVNVLGDTILVLDQELKVQWAWDSFDHLDVGRAAVGGEICTPQGGGCPPFYNSPQANDWLHGNSVQYTPEGNLLYSSRHQDWLIKIEYDGGGGSGRILWKLGKDGDFRLASGDPGEWFSHQHDGQIAPDGTLTVFDNGNTRYVEDDTAHSRGQALVLDEVNQVATPALNIDLGGYSLALGSAALLGNGNYHFNAGISPGKPTSRFIEVDKTGKIVYEMSLPGLTYRSFRLPDLYSASY
jgi:arylsulfate sulfotransferase